jgi:hypothetical protein
MLQKYDSYVSYNLYFSPPSTISFTFSNHSSISIPHQSLDHLSNPILGSRSARNGLDVKDTAGLEDRR